MSKEFLTEWHFKWVSWNQSPQRSGTEDFEKDLISGHLTHTGKSWRENKSEMMNKDDKTILEAFKWKDGE